MGNHNAEGPRVTPFYRQIIGELEHRRRVLGWPMDRVNDAAGLQNGYYNKAVTPEKPCGRVMQWGTLDLALQAMFPDGYRVVILPPSGERTEETAERKQGMFA